MKTLRVSIALGAILISGAVGIRCAADEPSEREQIEELRREVADLRQALAELTKRLEGHEYQQLPRMETIVPRPTLTGLRPAPPLEKNLRFPIDIERGSATPAMFRTRARWLR